MFLGYSTNTALLNNHVFVFSLVVVDKALVSTVHVRGDVAHKMRIVVLVVAFDCYSVVGEF